jgi:predicted Zn-dependent protease
MDARLIYAGDRLYMLVAAFPSARARRDQNVARFFNSFKLLPTTPVNRSSAAGSAASN